LIGKQIKILLFPFVSREFQYYGSFWGNHTDLGEVMELAKKGLIKKIFRNSVYQKQIMLWSSLKKERF
jgi:D-arabinose 1-dehydrogenase-like Zn-dependent alcohol dehydrogenase